jgi:hypothetical protein
MTLLRLATLGAMSRVGLYSDAWFAHYFEPWECPKHPNFVLFKPLGDPDLASIDFL